MKRSLRILALLIALTAFGDSAGVTAHLRLVSADSNRTNLTFTCDVTVDNRTGAALVATTFPAMPRGLALRVTDAEGHVLATMYAHPMIFWSFYSQKEPFQLHPGSQTFSKLWYNERPNGPGPLGLSLPPEVKRIQLQIVGTLSGCSYTNRLTSNVVETDVP